MVDKLFDRFITPLSPEPSSLSPTGKPKAPVSAILFDVYGTLFVSRPGDTGGREMPDKITRQLASLMDRYQITGSVKTLIAGIHDAVASKHTEMRSMGIDYPEVEIDRIWMSVLNIKQRDIVRRFALEYELIANPVYPMPHLQQLLIACKSKSVRMGIISNAQFYTPLLFERFCGGRPEALGFDAGLVLYSYRLKVAKPSPVPFRIASECLASYGIQPGSALYMGNDMLNDIVPAHAAGFQTALFAGDAHSLKLRPDDPRCEKVQPDMVITDLSQLIEHLKR